MIETTFYINSKPQPTIYVLNVEDGKLTDIFESNFYPLLGEYKFTRVNLPTRQQLHSRRNYIKEKYRFLAEAKNPNVGQIVATIKDLFEKEIPYESPIKQQDRYTVHQL